MNKKPVIELRKLINNLTLQINQLKDRINGSQELNMVYNRLLIERACARKKLKDFQSRTIFSCLFKKVDLKPKKKLICDYFNSKK